MRESSLMSIYQKKMLERILVSLKNKKRYQYLFFLLGFVYEKLPQFCGVCKAIGYGEEDYTKQSVGAIFMPRRRDEAFRSIIIKGSRTVRQAEGRVNIQQNENEVQEDRNRATKRYEDQRRGTHNLEQENKLSSTNNAPAADKVDDDRSSSSTNVQD